MPGRSILLVWTAAAVLVACSVEPEAPPPPPAAAAPAEAAGELEGTSWRLVRIQSMDDREFVPDDGNRYTLSFESGGTVAVRADCNRGRGAWTREEPSGLTFGPLAMTRMACPPDSLDGRFLQDLAHVRSYVLHDGTLFLATMADGAILEFEPVDPAAGEPAG